MKYLDFDIYIKEVKAYYPDANDLILDLKGASDKGKLDYQGAVHMVEGACFLVSNYDITKFMQENGGDKRYSDETNWRIYRDRMARAILKIAREAESGANNVK